MPEQIIRRRELPRVTGLVVSRIYELMERGEFPRPIRLGDRAVGWLASEVEGWQRTRIARRDAHSEAA